MVYIIITCNTLYILCIEWIIMFYLLLCMCLPHIHIFWNPNLLGDCIRRWGLWEVFGHVGKALINGTDILIKGSFLALFLPCENKGRRQLSMNQESGPNQTLNLPALWSRTFQPLELWEVNVCCLNCPVYDMSIIAAWTKTYIYKTYVIM